MSEQCHATCCAKPPVETHKPYCSAECAKLTRAVAASKLWTPKQDSNFQYVPPAVPPWSWLDARAGQ